MKWNQILFLHLVISIVYQVLSLNDHTSELIFWPLTFNLKLTDQDAEAPKDVPAEEEEVIDIDLNDPEVAAAATKIQASFKGYKARKDIQSSKVKSKKRWGQGHLSNHCHVHSQKVLYNIHSFITCSFLKSIYDNKQQP